MGYLNVNVLTCNAYPDCSNNGVTKHSPTKLVVPCERGNITEADVETWGYIILEPRTTGEFFNFKPVGIKGHFMMGGNFVYSSDSRFRDQYGNQPVAVHDRIES